MIDALSIVSSQPPNPYADLKTKEDKDDWFKQNILYGLSFYDRKTFLPSEGEASAEYSVSRMERCWRYVRGTQDVPSKYKHTVKDQQNRELPTQWIGGQKIGTLVDFLNGTSEAMIQNFRITVKAVSKDTQNERTRLLESLRTKMLLKNDYKDFETLGVGYNPIGNKDKEFHNAEEAERWMNMDYQEEAAVWGQKITNDIFHRNHMPEQLATSAFHTWVTGLTAAHIYTFNGRVIIDRLDSDCVFTNTVSGFDPFHRKDTVTGFIEWFDKSSIITRWGDQLGPTAVEEIKKCTAGSVGDFIPMYGSRFLGYSNVGGGLKFSKVTVYWKGSTKINWNDGEKDKFGYTPFYKTKNGEGGKYGHNCIFQGTLIGNRWLVDCGIAPNQVKDLYNPGESDMPIKVFTPGIVMGQLNSIVSKLHQLQDLVDYYTNEIKKVVSKNVGRGYVFYSNLFDGPQSPASFFSDLENFGITFMTKKKGEPGFNQQSDEKLMDPVDMTLDVNVRELAALRAEQERIMDSVVNLSPIAMGSQQDYVSQGTQTQSISQSNLSTMSVMSGFTKHAEQVMQFAANMGKIVHSMESGKIIPIAGDRGREFLKETKEFSHEELGIYIQILDVIDAQGRMEMERVAMALAQNSQLSFLDWLKVRKSVTYSEALDYMEMAFKKQERTAKEQQEFALAQQEIEAQKQAQMNRQSIGGKLQATAMQTEQKQSAAELQAATKLAEIGSQQKAA